MALLTTNGIGIMATPHDTIANLWVREIDQSSSTYPKPIVSGVIKNVADADIDNNFGTANVFLHGCILTQVDGTSNLSAQWENVGSLASPAWERFQTA